MAVRIYYLENEFGFGLRLELSLRLFVLAEKHLNVKSIWEYYLLFREWLSGCVCV